MNVSKDKVPQLYDKKGTKRKKVTSERVLNMKRNWKENKEKWEILGEDSQALKDLYHKVQSKNLESKQKYRSKSIENEMEFIEKCQQNMEVFQQLKLLKIGEFVPYFSNAKLMKLSLSDPPDNHEIPKFILDLPGELSSEITDTAWKQHAELLLITT
ncbi:hypothetical protein PGT21_017148 [Puccinia graminis f. sp. tritici]|uniref:Uncharacterized protein n=1 Tax=Puccinia graminis f. sp. tritici TaxID=56615 RepID=A0A5B0PBG9_PUCGR|nr:hypothetical protein PGT21_017148 [Puccinia graminis f. sp. tritici]